MTAARPEPASAPAARPAPAVSTAKNDTISRIAPVLSPGTHVSTSKNDINYVVTEYGVAQLRGKSAGQRARELIGIAHPNFRAELTAQAKHMKLF